MEERLKNIKAFVFDIDGVMTDGGILATLDGELLRTFDAKDAFALRMAAMKGYVMGAITGGRSKSIQKRLATCGFKDENIYLGSRIKINDFNDFCDKNSLKPEEVMYFGDDIPDIPVIIACGCGVCPSDAVEEVKAVSDLVSDFPGGRLCVRNTLEITMKAQGMWEIDYDQYNRMF